ncbi:hypothetical protein [Antrihabitans sp. YC2-6]|uniref:hypothetical protein n=1 Tax=Antrihabitans sp. YC2-6 TaxID=2799498 RepID=UPI0018F5837F|nr:hypothetical protein [Antrihabitans sp. YC2-6]MBJ8344191.1 hypothetical protein [Antrihabitans sp. YC2-6]
MSDLVTRAQLVILAKQLHVPVERVQYLEKLGAAHLLELRQAVADFLFDENSETFNRISALVPIVPLSIAMPIVQKVTAPEMAGRAAGAVGVAHPKKAVQAMTLVKPEYGALCAPFMDPRAVGTLAETAPHEPVVAIANVLLASKDYITGGLFVEAATPELIRAVEAGVDDDEGLIRTGSYVYSGKVLSEVLRVMVEASPARISRLVRTTVEGPVDLQLAALSVFSRLDGDLVETIGDVLFDEIDVSTVATLVRNYLANEAGSELLEFAGNLSSSALDTFAANPVLEDDDALRTLVDAASDKDAPGVWRGLVDVTAHANAATQAKILDFVLETGDGIPARLAHVATAGHLWPSVLRLLSSQDDSLQERIAEKWQPSLADGEHATVARHIQELRLDDSLKALKKVLAR